MKLAHLTIVLFLYCTSGLAQELYDVAHIPEIKIYFAEDNWDEILDAFHVAGDEERLMCQVEIDGTLLDSVGIRYKGFSSVSVDYTKNPFNIKLDYLIPGQSYQGKDKIKLSNVIQDPSFVREVLSYEIGRKYMPASQANFARVFINDEFWGLYSNVESVDKEFLVEHFNTTNNPFFKGNPDDLDLFGENSNLSNSPGENEEDYHGLYELKSDNGWAELLELIEELNDNPDNIESVLNVDRALWMHAFNYALINFDSYVGYAQNYYLYYDQNGQFNTIPWDLNMSFASYRLADASEFWDGFNIEEAKTMDPLQHYNNVSVFPRPLMRNLFENDIYRRMYLAHLRTIIEENFSNGDYMERAQFFQDLIDADVQADDNKFYSYQDFLDNLNTTVSDLVDYPGIADLMDARSEYLLAYPGIEDSPTFTEISWSESIESGGEFIVSATTENASAVSLYYRYGGSGLFTRVDLVDDGSGVDDVADDGVFNLELTNTGNVIQFYFYADNWESGLFDPQRAAYEFHTVESQVNPQDLVINEFMPSNVSTVTDDNAEFDDWIELFNNTDSHLSTAGMYLSDDATNPTKWAMPNMMIEPSGFLIIWADEQGSQGALHANFQISSLGEYLSIAYGDSTIIDEHTFDLVADDQSLSRFPNGTGPFVEMNTTFGDFNEPVSVPEHVQTSKVWPNPSPGELYIQRNSASPATVLVRNLEGRIVSSEIIQTQSSYVDLSTLANGIYLLEVREDQSTDIHKVIIHNQHQP